MFAGGRKVERTGWWLLERWGTWQEPRFAGQRTQSVSGRRTGFGKERALPYEERTG